MPREGEVGFDEGFAVAQIMSNDTRLRRLVRDLQDDLQTVIAQRDQLQRSLAEHQHAIEAWREAHAKLQHTIEHERQDFQAQLKHERVQRMIDSAVIAGKTAQVKAAGAEMRACSGRHEMLEDDENGIQRGLQVFREAFDQDLRDQGVENPEQYRAN